MGVNLSDLTWLPTDMGSLWYAFDRSGQLRDSGWAKALVSQSS